MKIIKALKDYVYLAIFLCLLSLLLLLPVFTNFNYFILDRFQGQIEPRKEIVIIGIDDSSLQNISAWPWNRDIFAKAFVNLDKLNPRVVGLDILFLEDRVGDVEFNQALNDAKFKTVFGVKVENDKLLNPKFLGTNLSNGLIDFSPDNDGKIRRTDLSRKVENKCQNSFALDVFSKYLSIKNSDNCKTNLQLRNNNLPNNLEFNYTNQKFTEYSFLDLYNNNLTSGQLKDKIVIIGSVAKDLRSNLNDNFTGISGSTINGVEIHANVINSLLNNKYLQPVSYFQVVAGTLLLAMFVFWIGKKLDNNILELSIFIVILLLINLLGILVYNYGYSWYFIQTNLLLIFSYFYFLAYKYLFIKKQSRFVEKAFTKYVNPEILKQIKSNLSEIKLGGEKKAITVMFSDIRGFTSFSENLSPEELIKLINSYLTLMTEIILQNGGTVDKYIGDAIMAFWNAPTNQENHQYLAVKTSLEMQLALDNFNTSQTRPIQIGIGINTGEVVVGNVGSESRFDYTVLGDNVNLGSRLEGLTKKYGLTTLVAINVVKDLDKNSNLIYRIVDEVRVKGKKIALKICEPLENTPSNLKLKKDYEQALLFYQKGQFSKAIEIFKDLKTLDICSQKMLERIEIIEANLELKNNWNGIWTWDEK